MKFHYPNGKKYVPVQREMSKINNEKKWSYSNRGMTLEEDINETNEFYLANGIASIHKKPTPVQIVQVDYPKRSAAVIKEAYFKQASTTDYNGVYKGKYIDFEAKETQNLTSFPLKNFHEHQINHMETILKQKGICFVLLRFSATEEVYLLEAQHLLMFWQRMKDGGRKSITKEEIEMNGYHIPLGFNPRIDYIKKIDYLYNLG
ncbi:Holliday junction resolvase RecU [Bacillus sp. S/N-304-OC-R1]|uniref:Holliday junction resolvase RecU n=1 Tax=Bacillus sp. S/N-304-OC-R1 TaxID=2758034 RepID=UPI001C8EE5CF|nr:Holliday junction resolvase RecU [Bacillus sp. S/N-304-OC-R1]MBY0122626.1 Holliday junction resolvase RecU [Bacillus sp. S/N-304-OC-R1]